MEQPVEVPPMEESAGGAACAIAVRDRVVLHPLPPRRYQSRADLSGSRQEPPENCHGDASPLRSQAHFSVCRCTFSLFRLCISILTSLTYVTVLILLPPINVNPKLKRYVCWDLYALHNCVTRPFFGILVCI